MSELVVRPLRDSDRDVVLDVVLQAFRARGEDGSLATDGSEENEIVKQVWALGASVDGLDLVAEVDGEVVGHALGSTVDLGGRVAVGVAPLSVRPDHQGRGIGSALMRTLLAEADSQGWPLVVLLGAPEYYSRFGFEPSRDFDIVYPPIGAGDIHFQVWRGSAYDPSWKGDVVYCWERADP